MLYTSRILKENEHVIKGYHLCFNLKNALNICQNGTSLQDNGIGGQKGGLFLWHNFKGTAYWLKKYLACEKQAYLSGLNYTPVPEHTYILEFHITKTDFRHPNWQPDFGLNGNIFIPLILKHLYKLHKKNLLTHKKAFFYLNCPQSKERTKKILISEIVLSDKNLHLCSKDKTIDISNLKKNSVLYSGVIQHLHDFLYAKSHNYRKEFSHFLKKMYKKSALFAMKYCGKKPLKPVAIEIWDSKLLTPISRMENISVFMQEKSFHQPLFYQQNIRQ